MTNTTRFLMQSKLTAHQAEVVRQVRALKALTEKTGTRTTRTINDLLQAQSDADLRAISLELYGN